MSLTFTSKRAIRQEVADHLLAITDLPAYRSAKPDAKRYFEFIASRLLRKLRLTTSSN